MANLDQTVGFDIETGGKPWDPWGLATISKRNKLSINPDLKWLQEAEIKHGRICMLAFLGIVVPASFGVFLPNYPSEPDPFAAFGKALLENPLGMAQIGLGIGIIEGHYYPGDFWTGGGDRKPGEFGFDPLGFSKKGSDKEKQALQLKEIKNGRLAMIAVAAFAAEKAIPGSVPLLKAAFPAVPL